MGIVKGLKNINERVEKDNAPREKKVPYLSLKDGETVRLRFLQELDSDSPGYNEKAGLGFLAIEHQAGGNFKKRALCTIDEGKCFGCEQHQKDYKAGWRQKSKLYVNVLVTRDGQEPEVAVLSQGNGPKSVTPWLLEYAGDNGSITSQAFKLKRQGAGQTDTQYTLTPGKFDEAPYDVTQHELVNLDDAVRDIPYDEQAAYYLSENQSSSGQADASTTSTEIDW